MFKKVLLIAVALCLVLVVCSCSSNDANDASNKDEAIVGEDVNEQIKNEDASDTADDNIGKTDDSKDFYEIVISDSIDELEEALDTLESTIESETKNAIDSLAAEYEKLTEGITSYSEYVANVSKIEAFYDKVNATSEEIAVSLYKYSVIYAGNIINAQISTDEMYDAVEGIYDCIYDGAGDILYDGIYDGILDDIYDDFYDGILEDRDESVAYKDWSNIRSDEYKMWSDTRSDCYEHWSDMRSDVYGFWSDIRGELWSDDLEGARKELDKFKEDVEEDNGTVSMDTSNTSDAKNEVDTKTENNDIGIAVEYDKNDLKDMITYIEMTGEKYSAEIEEKADALIEAMGKTYKGYKDNKTKISEFYESVLTSSDEFLDILFTVTGDYYRCVAKKQLSDYSAWNSFMSDMYDAWDGVMDDYYDTWDNRFEEIYDICDELIELEYDSGVWSDMYDEYSDAWSDMYDKYSDTWSDLYGIYSDVWSEFYSGKADIEDILS